jgi:CheY-like chemotaxis protein
LVVDDNQDSAESLTLLRRAAGHEASLTTDASGALRMAQNLHPEVVFLDIGMPGGRKSVRRSSSEAAE